MEWVTFFIEKQGTNERDVTVSFSTVNGSATGEIALSPDSGDCATGKEATECKCACTIYSGFLPASTDYATTNQSVTFGPSDTLLNVTVPISDDSVYELQETFSALLTTTDPGVVIIANTASATINDNDSKFSVTSL